MKKLVLLLLLVVCSGNTWAGQTTIRTVAGGGSGNATSAAPGVVTGIAPDPVSGGIYLSFSSANIVMRLESTGALTTVAGTGTAGYSGDHGSATSAQLNAPVGIAVDSDGNLYIADSLNNRVREVSNGTITTVAGNGTFGYSGDGGQATAAQVGNPLSVAVDASGNIYVVEAQVNAAGNGAEGPFIRKVSNGVISTVDDGDYIVGQIAVDAAGNIFYADHINSVVNEISNGTEKTVAGGCWQNCGADGSQATNVELDGPIAVSLDTSNNLYIVEQGGNRIRKVASNGVITTVAGDGKAGYTGDGGLATSAELALPIGVTVDDIGNVYIADAGNQRIRKVSSGSISTVLGSAASGSSGDGGAATSTELSQPAAIALDSSGNLYIAEQGSQRVRKVSNGIITTVAGNGTQGYKGDNGPATEAELSGPLGLYVDSTGNLYIADTGNNVIREVSGGVISTIAGNGTAGYSGDSGHATSAELNTPTGLGMDASGNLYIADSGNVAIRKVTNGVITTFAGGGPGSEGGVCGTDTLSDANPYVFTIPTGVAFDKSGNLYVADTGGNQRVFKISSGNITQFAGAGECGGSAAGPRGYNGDSISAVNALLNYPVSVAVDNSGNVYIADSLNQRVRKVSNGVITTVAGNGKAGFGGDGGSPTAAQLTWPSGVAVDASGNVYIADLGNNRIREVSATTPAAAAPTFSPAAGTYTSAQSVTITDSTPNSTIYYTTNGTAPSTSSTKYTGKITVSSTETIQAFAVASGYTNSSVTVATYTITLPAATPVFTPAAGTYTTAQSVTITDTTPGAIIYYTINGTIPSTSSTKYTGAITVSATETIEAIAVASSYATSPVASAKYTITPPTDTQATYNFVGVPFTSFTNTACPPTCKLTGSMTLSQPLAANLNSDLGGSGSTVPVAFSFTDGKTTITNQNATTYGFNFDTDSSGNITYYSFYMAGPGGGAGFSAYYGGATQLTQEGTNLDSYQAYITETVGALGGTWTSGLQFIPVTPCRVADTRNATGAFGGPAISGGSSRAFNIPQSACNIPSNAAAYSLNVTVVPSKTLDYLTLWPAGQSQPNVSTLNSLDGRIKANAAIVPAGTSGGVSVYVSDTANVILDIDGYFVPAGSNASALAFYPLAPCRIADTRNATGSLGGPSIGASQQPRLPHPLQQLRHPLDCQGILAQRHGHTAQDAQLPDHLAHRTSTAQRLHPQRPHRNHRRQRRHRARRHNRPGLDLRLRRLRCDPRCQRLLRPAGLWRPLALHGYALPRDRHAPQRFQRSAPRQCRGQHLRAAVLSRGLRAERDGCAAGRADLPHSLARRRKSAQRLHPQRPRRSHHLEHGHRAHHQRQHRRLLLQPH